MATEKVYCRFCEQTYLSSSLDKCSLCGKKGGMAIPIPEPPSAGHAAILPTNSSVEVQDLDLGNEIFRCGLLSGAQTLAAQGQMFSWIGYYVIFPFFLIPYVALMSAIVLSIALKVLDLHFGEINGPFMWIAFVAFYVFYFWLWRVRPRQDHLILFEHGIKARFGFQRLTMASDSIKEILIGRQASTLERGLRSVFGIFKPRQGAWLDSMDDTSLTILTKDGQCHVMKWILTRFEPDDIERFFDELVRRHPHLKAPP